MQESYLTVRCCLLRVQALSRLKRWSDRHSRTCSHERVCETPLHSVARSKKVVLPRLLAILGRFVPQHMCAINRTAPPVAPAPSLRPLVSSATHAPFPCLADHDARKVNRYHHLRSLRYPSFSREFVPDTQPFCGGGEECLQARRRG
jgi:hypothetical protein